MNYTELTHCSFLLDENHFGNDPRKILKQSSYLSNQSAHVRVLLVAQSSES